MWPLEQRRDVVRVGRDRVEYWAWTRTGLICESHQDLAPVGGPNPVSLTTTTRALLEAAPIRRTGSSRWPTSLDLVMESAWLPVVLLEMGGGLWSRPQVEGLLRHRLTHLFDDRNQSVSTWDLRVDYRAGDAQGLGYGMSPAIRDAALDVAAAGGVHWRSMQPAFAWSWQRLQRQRRELSRGSPVGGLWWVWLEQDRSIICRVDRDRVAAMNPGAAVLSEATSCLHAIEIEGVRSGVLAEPVRGIVAGFQSRFSTTPESALYCLSVASPPPEPRAASQPPFRASHTT